MTALPPKADVHLRSCYVAFVPIATQRTAAKKASAIRSPRRRVTETIPGSSARALWPFERRTRCDLGVHRSPVFTPRGRARRKDFDSKVLAALDTAARHRRLDNAFFYAVPNYQREFVWGEQQVRKLVDDIYNEFLSGGDQHQTEYFVGSMVVCPRGDGTYEVIDGQQRLTTFFIFFCALREFFRSNENRAPQDLHPKIATVRINERGEDETRFRIHLHYMKGEGTHFCKPNSVPGYKI
jgi:hypothetical protein